MRFLTQIDVSLAEAARRNISDLYAWHKMIWQAFVKKDGAKRTFLFRVDTRSESFQVLLLSQNRPYLADWGTWRTKEISRGFLDHRAYRFQLKANPTMRRSSDRRRIAIYQEKRLHQWMMRKAASAGCRIVEHSLIIGAPIDERFTRNSKYGKHVSVDFQGMLAITDRNQFRDAFNNGIGSGKSFGFGMLMLEPISLEKRRN